METKNITIVCYGYKNQTLTIINNQIKNEKSQNLKQLNALILKENANFFLLKNSKNEIVTFNELPIYHLKINLVASKNAIQLLKNLKDFFQNFYLKPLEEDTLGF